MSYNKKVFNKKVQIYLLKDWAKNPLANEYLKLLNNKLIANKSGSLKNIRLIICLHCEW